MTEKEINDAIEVISDSLEINDTPVTGVYSTLLNYLKANTEDILEASDFFDVDEDQLPLF